MIQFQFIKINFYSSVFFFRSLRISTPYTDSVCSSSAESSDCESNAYPQHSDAPIEIITGLFLGNSSHSEDLKALQTYNIKYILNVTPDLPNIFEASGAIKYLQIPITDHGSQDLSAYFPTAIKFIGKQCIHLKSMPKLIHSNLHKHTYLIISCLFQQMKLDKMMHPY